MGTVVRSLIFDLDGTLIDSRAGIIDSLQQAVRAIFPDMETGSLSFEVGPPVREIMQAALGVLDEVQLAALELEFRQAYDNHGWESVSLYPDVLATLNYLFRYGIRLFIVTNKPKLPTGRILSKMCLHDYFECVMSRDSRQPIYPDKFSMLSCLFEDHCIVEASSVYIGDSLEDLIAADLCKVRFIGVGYGYGSFPSPRRDFPILTSFSELLNII